MLSKIIYFFVLVLPVFRSIQFFDHVTVCFLGLDMHRLSRNTLRRKLLAPVVRDGFLWVFRLLGENSLKFTQSLVFEIIRYVFLGNYSIGALNTIRIYL